MAGWIYEIRNTITGCVYIGSTRDYRRFKRHRVLLLKGTHYNKPLQADWDVYGKAAFAWNVLEELEGSWVNLDFDARLLTAERRHIDQAKAAGDVYNIAPISSRHEEWLRNRERGTLNPRGVMQYWPKT